MLAVSHHSHENRGPARGLKRLAKRSKWLVVAVTIAKDQRDRWAARRGAAGSTCGATHESFSLDQSLGYIDSVFHDYLRFGGLKCTDLEGKAVLELGPGDNYGVALRFLACGADRVVSVDKFATRRNEEQQRRIYEALLSRIDERGRTRAGQAVRLEDGVEFDPARIRAIEGVAVEETGDLFDPGTFDLIVSRAVLEHLYDLDAAFAAMDRLLAPGGLMLHKVDFRDHGMFTGGGSHPLTFLTVPGPLYLLMTRHSGRPNRRLANWYRAKFDALGYERRLVATKLVGDDEELETRIDDVTLDPSRNAQTLEFIRSIRSRLRPEFRSLSNTDLAVAGIFIAARKPEA